MGRERGEEPVRRHDLTSLERSRQIIAIAITTSGMDNPIARADRTPASTASRSHMAENAIVAASIATNIRIREWERADTTDAASAMRKSAVMSGKPGLPS